MATYTCTVFDNAPKFHHIGNLTQAGAVMWTATSSAGDIGFLCKVPHGAKIVDFSEYHSTGATAQGVSFGFASGAAAGGGANASILIASGAQAGRNNWSMSNQPLQISVSDLDTQRYAILVAKMESGTATTSLQVNFSVTYRFDGPDTR